jgi:hypothetical protein
LREGVDTNRNDLHRCGNQPSNIQIYLVPGPFKWMLKIGVINVGLFHLYNIKHCPYCGDELIV